MFYISAGGNQIYKPLDDLLVLFNPKLTLEIGKAGSLEFDIPPVNPYYDRLNQLTTEVTVDMDDEEIFHGRVLSVERAFNNIRHVYCEGDLSYLIDSVQKGVQYSGTTHNLFNQIIANHNARVDASKRFMVGTVNIENRNIILVGQSNSENINAGNIDYKQIAIDSIVDEWNNTFDYIQTCLIDYCGGYLRTRRVNGTTYIDLLDDFGSNSVQPIELGRNLLDLTEEVSVEDVFTVLIPLGDDNLTIAPVNGGSDELVDTAAVKRFGRIVRTHVFSNVTSASTLLENARRYMATNVNVPRTINVRAVDLHLVNKTIPAIKLGDKVQIASYVHDVNDILTCTKIEYDLEHPDNNNYTFGNPKQTLTQRYREDIRLSNDTYGNSPSATSASPSAASAQAAAAASKEADKKRDEALENFYKTWIENSDETGLVELRAQYWKDRETLINDCGILLDASTGNVNIQSMHRVLDDHGHQIAKNTADISIIQTDEYARYQSVLDRVENLAGVEAQHHTEITQEVGVLGSQIGLLASDINDYDDKLTKTVANINLIANDLEARIDQKVSYIDTIDGRLTGRMASIEMWANSAESAIALKADKVYVDGLLQAESARIDSLMSGNSTAQHLLANTITASQINLRVGSGTVPLVSTVHSHNITAREGDNGTITISLGSAVTDEIPQQTSFNIADTKYFKDHVAAVDIRSLEADSYSTTGDYEVTLDNSYVRYSNEQIVGRIRINFANNDNPKTAVVKVSGTRAYNAGIDYGAESAVAYSILPNGPAGLPTWDEEDEVWYANVPAVATAQGTRANGSKYTSPTFTRNLAVNVTAIYDAGKAAGSGSGGVDAISLTVGQNQDETVSYSDTVHYYYIPIKATATDGQSHTKDAKTTLSLNANDAYDQGVEEALADVDLSVSPSETSFGRNTHTKNVVVNSVVTYGNTTLKTEKTTVEVDASNVYGWGKSDAEASVTVSLTTSQTGWNSSTHKKNLVVNAAALSGDNTSLDSDSRTIEIDASTVYTQGRGSVTATVTGMTTSSSDYGTYDQSIGFGSSSLYTVSGTTYGKIKVSLGNGTADKVVRIGMPSSTSGVNLNDVVVTRLYTPNRGWVIENGDVSVLASLTAGSQSVNAQVNVNDIVTFFAPAGATVLATETSTANNNYNLDVDTAGYTNAFYKSGNYQYVRFQLQNDDGNNLDIVRVRLPSSSTGISEVFGLVTEASGNNSYLNYSRQVSFAAGSIYAPSGSSTQYVRVQVNLSSGSSEVIRVALPASSGASGQIEIDRIKTSSSVNPYYGSNNGLDYYAYTSGKHWVYVQATCEGATPRSRYIDINDIVNKAYTNGTTDGGGLSWNIYQHYDMGEADGWDCVVTTGFGRTHTFWSPQRIYE